MWLVARSTACRPPNLMINMGYEGHLPHDRESWALMAVVHDGATPAEAMEYLK